MLNPFEGLCMEPFSLGLWQLCHGCFSNAPVNPFLAVAKTRAPSVGPKEFLEACLLGPRDAPGLDSLEQKTRQICGFKNTLEGIEVG